METKVSELENELTDPSVYADVDKLLITNQEYENVKAALEEANKAWEIKAMEIERLEGNSPD